MQIQLEIPDDLSCRFADDVEGLTRALLEALAVDGYHTHKLSEWQAVRLLGLESRFQFHGVLKAHDVYLNFSEEDIRKDIETLDRFRHHDAVA